MKKTMIVCLIAAVVVAPRGYAQEPTIDWSKVDCKSAPRTHDEANLCEQRRMAKAAETTVALNWAQVVVSVLGFGGLLWSLYYVRKSTVAAGTAADAAQKSVEEAGVTAKRQLRAYMTIAEPRLEGLKSAGGKLVARIALTNSGQTPAYEVKGNTRLDLVPHNFEGWQIDKEPESTSTIGSGRKIMITETKSLTADEYDQVKQGKMRLCFFGRYEYKDAFKGEQHTSFRLMVHPDDIENEIPWTSCRDGNDAS